MQLKIDKYIAEQKTLIRTEIISKQKQKLLLVAPMKTGKTTYIMEELQKELKDWIGIQLIFVSPKTTLLDNTYSKYGGVRCYGDIVNCSLNDKLSPVLTTPDSLYKVIGACKSKEREYYIVYDEVHELITSSNFRNKMAYPLEAYNNDLCFGFMGMTATPEVLEEYEREGEKVFDTIIKFEPKEKFVQAEKSIITKDLKRDNGSIANFIFLEALKERKQIIARINNKKDIENIEKLLSKKGLKVFTWYTGNEEEKDLETLNKMLKNIEFNFDVILTTCLIDVGIEFNLKDKPIIINIMDSNTTISEDIQFIGRLRNGTYKYYIAPTFKDIEDDTEDIRKPLKEIKAELIKSTTILKDLINSSDSEAFKNTRNSLIKYKIENGKKIAEINHETIQLEAYKMWLNYNIKDETDLREYLENHPTYNTGSFMILNVSNMKIDEEIELLSKGMKEEKKREEELFKAEKEKALKEIFNFKEREKKVILSKEYEIHFMDLKVKEDNLQLYDFYHGGGMKDFRERVYHIKDIMKIDILKAFDLVFNDEDKEILKELQYKRCNRLFDKYKPKPTKIILMDHGQEYKIVYHVRTTILDHYGKERDVRVGNKLYKLLKENKCLSKKDETLEKHLQHIYSISNNIIKSIK